MTLILNDADVTKLLNWKRCVDACEDAYGELAFGRAAGYTRRDVCFQSDRPGSVNRLVTMEGGLQTHQVVAQRVDVETVTRATIGGVYKQIEVPITESGRWVGLVYLYSFKTGELLAIITDGQIQRMRVAGTSAVAIRHMTRNNASTLGLLGAGEQAEAHALATATIRNIRTIKVYSPTASKRKAFCEKLAKTMGIDVVPVDAPELALKGSDIVLAATSARQPVCHGDWIEEGQHLGSIVSSEFDSEVWKRADVAVCSNLEKAEVRAVGDAGAFSPRYLAAPYDPYLNKIRTLTDLLKGTFLGRRSETDVTVFLKGLGLGIEFASTGKVIFDEAVRQGIGKQIPSEWFTQDLHT